MNKLARKVALVGAGMCKFGRNFPFQRNPDMWVEAWLNAVKTVDNGIEPKDIDACYIGNYSSDLFNQPSRTFRSSDGKSGWTHSKTCT